MIDTLSIIIIVVVICAIILMCLLYIFYRSHHTHFPQIYKLQNEFDNDLNIEEQKIFTSNKANEKFIRDILISLQVFLTFEIILSPKYVILPTCLIQLLGGPLLLIIPWSLSAFIIGVSQCAVYTSKLLRYKKKNTISQLSIYSFASGDCEALDYDILVVSKFELSFWMITSILDLALSGFSIFVEVILITMVFISPDHIVTTGWEEQYNLAITEIIFCSISVLCRISIIILIILLYRSKNIISNAIIDKKVYSNYSIIEKLFAAFAFLGCFTSLIFCSIVLHDFLRYSYYQSASKAAYTNCDEMINEYCSLPFPSYVWLKDDPSTESGLRVNIQSSTLPYTKTGKFISGEYLNNFDGFSISSPLLWYLEDVDESQFISYRNIGQSVILNSTSLIINVDSGELHPHFAELDYLNPGDNKIAYLQPSKSLMYNTHYVVVIKALRSSSTQQMIATVPLLQEYISAYENQTTYVANSNVNQQRYERFTTTIFPILQSIGVNMNELQIVWDFHTTSRSSLLSPIVSVHNVTLSRVGEVLGVTKDEIYQDVSDFIETLESTQDIQENDLKGGVQSSDWLYRSTLTSQQTCDNSADTIMASAVYYRINVPWFLHSLKIINNTIRDEYLGLIGENSSKVPMNGNVGIFIQVPCAVATGQINATSIVEFGHGIFDNLSAGSYSFLHQLANEHGWILWTMDWRGFSNAFYPLVLRMFSHSGDSDSLNDLKGSLIQGFVNKLAGRLIMKRILRDEKDKLMIPSNLLTSSLPCYFMADSMGGILGGAYSPFMGYLRSVFYVSGSPFSFLLPRSHLFAFLSVLMDCQVYNRVDARIIVTSWQLAFDAFESSGWVHSGAYDEISTLMEIALGDSTVTTISGRIMGVNLNSSQLQTSLFPVYGMSSESQDVNITTIAGSHIFVEGKFTSDAASIPVNNEIPETSTNVHGCLDTEVDSIKLQVGKYITTGIVSNFCDNGLCIYGETSSC